jgi:hypothetical protein
MHMRRFSSSGASFLYWRSSRLSHTGIATMFRFSYNGMATLLRFSSTEHLSHNEKVEKITYRCGNTASSSAKGMATLF